MALICFSSPKGGVGKTTLAANIAGALARAGQRVIALDLDPQNALRIHFGVALEDTAGFTCHLHQRPDWHRCLRETAAGVSLLPFGSSTMADALELYAAVARTPELLQRPLNDILSSPDICLVVDTPPGPTSLLATVLPQIDFLITVLLVDATSISLIPALDEHGGDQAAAQSPDQGVILNQFDPRTRLGGVIADAAARHLGERLLGIVYRDEHVAEAAAAQQLLAEYAPASKAHHDIAAIARVIEGRLRAPSHAADLPRRGASG